MVERIVVNPQEVRGLGNVVNDEKTKQDVDVFNSYVTAESDLIDGIRIGVMRMVYNDPNLLFSFNRLEKFLYVNSDEASLGWSSKKLTLDSDDLTIGFDADDKTLYVGTDVPPVVHDYSISFDSSSYSTSDGNVTAYVTLLDSSSPVSGASISLTGTGSTLSATTNSSGIATFNLTGISADCTLTATYDNVSDTATVTVSSSLFEDDCTSSSGLSNYGTPLMMKGSGGSVELTYDSGNNCYKVNPTSNRAGETMCIPITPMNSKDNYKLTFKIKHGSSVAQNQPSVFVYDNTLSAPTFYGIRYMGNGTMTCHTFNQSTDNGTNSVSYSTGISSKWFTITLQREGTSLTLKVDDENGVNRYNKTHTASGNINAVGFGVYVYDNTRYYYIKDIVAEAL